MCDRRIFCPGRNIKKKPKNLGPEGYRSPYLTHAKRALYHVSYRPRSTSLKSLSIRHESTRNFAGVTANACKVGLSMREWQSLQKDMSIIFIHDLSTFILNCGGFAKFLQFRLYWQLQCVG